MSARPLDQRETSISADDFVGRQPELDAIITLLLRNTRLVTLIGPGGIGKTRLAAKASERLQKARNTPVYWTRLARLPANSSVETVEEEVVRSVVETDFSGRSTWEALVTTLTRTDRKGRRLQSLLVLDNCEHVLPSAGRIIARLLDAIPELCVLATSREAIDWVDEHRFVVPPLTPDQALTLFRSRSEMTGNPLATEDELTLAARICRQMDYHPLFIRLAAGRLVRQPLALIMRQLGGDPGSDRRLNWLPGPTLGSEDRHRTINDVISWSYDLCGEKEKLLFDRMAVFASGFDSTLDTVAAFDVGADLDAIRTVCADPVPDPVADVEAGARDTGGRPALRAGEIEAALERLADQSLVSRHITATAVSYSLSENLRVYAQQRLRERSARGVDEYVLYTERHRNYYRDKVLHAAATYFGPDERELFNWAAAAWNNIIIAIERSLEPGGNAVYGLEICAGLLVLRLPFYKGSFREMRSWTERALDATSATESDIGELRVTAMALLVWIMLCQGQTRDAERLLDECVRTCAPSRDGDWRRTPQDELGLPAVVDFAWGVELLLARKDPLSVTVLDRAREKFDRVGNTSGAIPSEQFAALAATLIGPVDQARDLARRYLERTAAVGVSWTRLWAELTWSIALTRLGRLDEALALQRSVLEHLLPTREQWAALWAVQFRAWSLARVISGGDAAGRAAGRRATALATEIALLAGGTRTLRDGLGVDIAQLGPFDDIAGEAIGVAREVLGPRAYEAAEKRGATLRPELQEVHQLAMGTSRIGVPQAHAPRDQSPGWADLTAAEKEVATLVAAGWTNSAIAARRGTSRRTVDAQMAAILQKLQVGSRTQIAQFVPEQD
ncbi:putative ATPase/DNA-binding CsgD family transcriptional regulator [Nocardia transvalensis]|uniref:Putative ATPase/DNA-binding CsgD family transcriptional regulator n=1 Tax=Nocardia transvalensis TaxID=37333 RepID=A0A7W9ULB1_9NOCA|nr:LuxR C-terminal-related transcriptional regulator [Nocardia transvalensis]MBB5917373.1 putative ATPase/DNA-binding CsgD family transcriptional regulator [Nocardia transvalensis]